MVRPRLHLLPMSIHPPPPLTRSRRLFFSGGPRDGETIPFTWPLPTKIRVEHAGHTHRYVLEDAPKLNHPNGDGNLQLAYRYEGSSRPRRLALRR